MAGLVTQALSAGRGSKPPDRTRAAGVNPWDRCTPVQFPHPGKTGIWGLQRRCCGVQTPIWAPGEAAWNPEFNACGLEALHQKGAEGRTADGLRPDERKKRRKTEKDL